MSQARPENRDTDVPETIQSLLVAFAIACGDDDGAMDDDAGTSGTPAAGARTRGPNASRTRTATTGSTATAPRPAA